MNKARFAGIAVAVGLIGAGSVAYAAIPDAAVISPRDRVVRPDLNVLLEDARTRADAVPALMRPATSRRDGR